MAHHEVAGMSSDPVTTAGRPAAASAGPRLTAWRRGVALWLLSLTQQGLLLAVPLVAGAIGHVLEHGPGAPPQTRGFLWGFWLGVACLPFAGALIRPLTDLSRQLAGSWCGVPVGPAYRPAPPRPATRRDRLRWLLTDPATWRDVVWVVTSAAVSWTLPLTAWAAPGLLRRYGQFCRSLLAPTGQAELELRVGHLAQTRADTLDAAAAELRRIERDLHDGAQARLVAMGMTLDAADQLMTANPDAARALLAEARQSSARALADLRALVRGIHPPVLADRGLTEAVRALTLDLPLRVHYTSELTGRPPAPVESAAYFAVSELLTNVAKHAHARQAWVDLRQQAEALRIDVTDDGAGGADPARGTGLAGVERRLAAFDGLLAVSSPAGGPTVVTMEIPCALSSPKISSC
jgi:Histidine kinase/Putative sensor